MEVILVSGIDPGYAELGVSVLTVERKPRCIGHATIKTDPRTGSVLKRIEQIRNELANFYAFTGTPSLILTEDQRGVIAGMLKQGTRTSSSDQVLRVCGMIQTLAHSIGAQFAELTPGQMKSVLGIRATGKALKGAYRRVAERHFDGVFKGTEHSADAVAFGVVAAQHYRLMQSGIKR